jgi:transposase
MKKYIRIGVDLGKGYFQVHALENEAGVAVNRKISRGKFLAFFSGISPCRVGMEACGSSNYWAREIAGLGHEAMLIAPGYIKPYVKRGKNDPVDAEAICEAMSRPSMRFVPVKSAEQQAGLMLHKDRELLVKQRTMSVNALRGHLAEFGIVAAKGIQHVDHLLELARKDAALPEMAKQAVERVSSRLNDLDQAIAATEKAIAAASFEKRQQPLAGSGSRHRPAHRLGDRRQRARSQRVPIGARFFGLAGVDAEPELERRQGKARAHHQEGQPIYPQDASGREHLAFTRGAQAQGHAGRLDQRARRQEATKSGGRGAGQQAGQNMLGDPVDRRMLPRGDIRESLARAQ